MVSFSMELTIWNAWIKLHAYSMHCIVFSLSKQRPVFLQYPLTKSWLSLADLLIQKERGSYVIYIGKHKQACKHETECRIAIACNISKTAAHIWKKTTMCSARRNKQFYFFSEAQFWNHEIGVLNMWWRHFGSTFQPEIFGAKWPFFCNFAKIIQFPRKRSRIDFYFWLMFIWDHSQITLVAGEWEWGSGSCWH